MSEKRCRFLMGKPGLDGHDRGALVVCNALRDAGVEVIYTGRHQTPEEIVISALQEDVDVLGLSVLSGAHTVLAQEVIGLLKKNGSNMPVVIGGFIDPDEFDELTRIGVAKVFGVGSSLNDITSWVKKIH